MVLKLIYQLLTLAAVGSTQSPSSTTLSSGSAITTHTVAVGEAGLTYTPNTIIADVEDVVEFRFYPQNHSVARAEYKHPCIPYEYTGVNKVGFWSAFHPVDVVLQSPPQFSIVVNDTDPIFFYCSAPGACIQDGMIGVINPNSTQTLEVQLEYAKNSTLMFSPGQGYPLETTNLTASPTTSPRSSSNSSPLSPGAIAGIALGAVAIIALAGIIYWVYRRTKKRATQPEKAPQGPPSCAPQSPDPRPESYHAALPPNSPSTLEEISPKSYLNMNFSPGGFQSGVGFPYPIHLSPGPTTVHTTQGTSPEPQELAAEIVPLDGRKRSPRPFSFDEQNRHSRASEIKDI